VAVFNCGHKNLTIIRHPKKVSCTAPRRCLIRIETTLALAAVSNVVTHPNAPSKDTLAEALKPKLLDEVRARIRRLNYSIRSEDTYVDWER
jgi:hypothetical protein